MVDLEKKRNRIVDDAVKETSRLERQWLSRPDVVLTEASVRRSLSHYKRYLDEAQKQSPLYYMVVIYVQVGPSQTTSCMSIDSE